MAKKHGAALPIALTLLAAAALGVMVYFHTLNANESKPEDVSEGIRSERNVSADTEKIRQLIENMSLSDMVYQMMFVTPESLTGFQTVIQAGEATKNSLEECPVGGIIYFSQNLKDKTQITEMIKNTQEYSKIPLFIGVDEEGGRVARLGSNSKTGVTKQPAMKKIGESGDESKAYEVGKALARDISVLGFNVDFAPDADVLINPDNKEIGDRSFGSNPENVAAMVKNVVNGLQDNGVSSAIKHFPGHGAAQTDSHTGYTAVTRTAEELRSAEFIPFKAGIDADVDFVMVSHMTLVNATEEKVPSSMSKEVITDMLINELGYTGIVITDSFSMGAVTNEYSVKDAAVMAITAGADMILMPSSLAETHDAVVAAVEAGEIPRERIEESVSKILKIKSKRGIL